MSQRLHLKKSFFAYHFIFGIVFLLQFFGIVSQRLPEIRSLQFKENLFCLPRYFLLVIVDVGLPSLYF